MNDDRLVQNIDLHVPPRSACGHACIAPNECPEDGCYFPSLKIREGRDVKILEPDEIDKAASGLAKMAVAFFVIQTLAVIAGLSFLAWVIWRFVMKYT